MCRVRSVGFVGSDSDGRVSSLKNYFAAVDDDSFDSRHFHLLRGTSQYWNDVGSTAKTQQDDGQTLDPFGKKQIDRDDRPYAPGMALRTTTKSIAALTPTLAAVTTFCFPCRRTP